MSNQGGQTLTETTILNPIPKNTTYVAPSASISTPGNGTLSYSNTANLLLWEHGSIEGLEAITITYSVNVSPTMTLEAPITNTFTIDAPMLASPVTSERLFCVECYPADSIQPVYRLDPVRSGMSANNGPDDVDLGIWAKWKQAVGGQIKASAIISPDGTLIIGAGTSIAAFDPAGNGSQLWSYNVGGNVNATAALAANGTVYVPAGNKLVAVFPLPGSPIERWSFVAGGTITSAPVIGPDGTIYFGSQDGFVYAVSVFGELIWKQDTGHTINYSAPTLGPGNTLYIGNGEYLTRRSSLLMAPPSCSGNSPPAIAPTQPPRSVRTTPSTLVLPMAFSTP